PTRSRLRGRARRSWSICVAWGRRIPRSRSASRSERTEAVNRARRSREPSPHLSATISKCYPDDMRIQLTRKRKLTASNLERVPSSGGVYVLFGNRGSVAYVGKAKSLHAQLAEQLETGRIPASTFAFMRTETQAQATKLEHALIERWLPRFNLHVAS